MQLAASSVQYIDTEAESSVKLFFVVVVENVCVILRNEKQKEVGCFYFIKVFIYFYSHATLMHHADRPTDRKTVLKFIYLKARLQQTLKGRVIHREQRQQQQKKKNRTNKAKSLIVLRM